MIKLWQQWRKGISSSTVLLHLDCLWWGQCPFSFPVYVFNGLTVLIHLLHSKGPSWWFWNCLFRITMWCKSVFIKWSILSLIFRDGHVNSRLFFCNIFCELFFFEIYSTFSATKFKVIYKAVMVHVCNWNSILKCFVFNMSQEVPYNEVFG